LRSRSGRTVLVQTPVAELGTLKQDTIEWKDVTIEAGNKLLSGIALECFEITAEFETGSAEEFGFKIRTSETSETVAGYRVREQELFVDRTRSGEAAFHEDFSGRHAAKLEASNGRIRICLLVDTSSVEVFGNDGEAVITDLIYPEPGDQGLEIYAVNGSVRLVSMELSPLKSIW
jgi:fructan beta-fructosidase